MIFPNKTMSNEDYIKAVEGPIIDAWTDKVILEKTGLKSLFDDYITINKNMSYEDICDCFRRLESMTYSSVEVGFRFDSKYHESRKRACDVLLNSTDGRPLYENDFFSANTILEIMKEVRAENDFVSDDEIPESYHEAFAFLTEQIIILKTFKKMMFDTIFDVAERAHANMVGYK